MSSLTTAHLLSYTRKYITTLQYHETVGMVVVRFPVVLLIFIVVQVLTECVIVEFPPFTIIDIFALSSKVPRVQDMIHKVASQHIVADKVESFN